MQGRLAVAGVGVLPWDASTYRRLFADRLRAVRRAHGGRINAPGLSASHFAKMLGIEPERYRRYERAELEPPLEVLTKLRRLTGVSLDMLVSGDGDEKMILSRGMARNETMILADRWRITREAAAVRIEEAAEIMNVPLEDWELWERGSTRPTLSQLDDFASRFQVTLDFLVAGSLDGLQPKMRDLLVSKFPQLDAPSAAPDNADGPGERKTRAGNGR